MMQKWSVLTVGIYCAGERVEIRAAACYVGDGGDLFFHNAWRQPRQREDFHAVFARGSWLQVKRICDLCECEDDEPCDKDCEGCNIEDDG